jgi:Tol biopolymer transport system component
MRLDRLDKTVFVVAVVLALLLAFFLLRGDQIGAQITRSTPADNAQNVPARSPISFTFGEPMVTSTLEGKVSLQPEAGAASAALGALRWSGATASFVPSAALLPNTEYQLVIKAGATSARGRSMLRDHVIRFRTSLPRMAYLSPANAPTSDVYITRLEPNSPAQRLTFEPFGVHSYAISPDGTRVAYAAKRDLNGEMDLWLINTDGGGREQLLRCNDQVCQYPNWSADGTRIAYEQHNLIKGRLGNSPGPSRIFLLDVVNKQAYPLIDDSQRLGFLPRWSPVGDKLAFYDSTQSAVIVVDVATADQIELPSVYGDSGMWSPDGAQLIYSDLVPVEDRRYNQLLRVDLARSVITPALPLTVTNDILGVWSPSGDRIAFGRQARTGGAGIGVGGLGSQIWTVDANGQNARALTEDPGVNYGAISWSADGQWLVALRWDLNTPNAVPEVWLVNSTSSNPSDRRKLLTDAWQPMWFP